MKRRYRVTVTTTAVLEIDDAIFEAVDDEWRSMFYNLDTREEIERYLAEGVHRIVATPWAYDHDNALPRIAEYARRIGLGS